MCRLGEMWDSMATLSIDNKSMLGWEERGERDTYNQPCLIWFKSILHVFACISFSGLGTRLSVKSHLDDDTSPPPFDSSTPLGSHYIFELV